MYICVGFIHVLSVYAIFNKFCYINIGTLFRGCLRQPLYCFQIDVFIWLHVTDIYIYIYNTPTYGCTSMLTFISNVLGEVLGIGNLYCRPFLFGRKWTVCARPRDFENRLLSDVLANFGRFLPPLILEQTLTALLADGQRHSFETAPNRSSTSPRAFFDNGRARLRGLHSAAWNT